MTTETATRTVTKVEQTVVNGGDVTALGQTLDLVAVQPDMARFQFRNANNWIDGSHNRSTIQSFYGVGREDDTRTRPYVFDNDEPAVLLGEERAANPVEYLLHARAGCMTTTMVYHAAANGIEIHEFTSKIEGDIDIRGFTGVSEDVPKGFGEIRVDFLVRTEADAAKLTELTCMSPVFNTIKGSVPVVVNVKTW